MDELVVEVDCSNFAELYERLILELDKLTPHQKKKLKECMDKKHDGLHLRAPAGAGKTFIALHWILDVFGKSKDAKVLFVAQNEALVMFVAKWLYHRLRYNGSAEPKGTVFLRRSLERLHVLHRHALLRTQKMLVQNSR